MILKIQKNYYQREQLNSKDSPISLDFLINTEQNEINFFKERIQKLDLKEQILLNSLNDIKSEITDEDTPFIPFDANSGKKMIPTMII